MRIVVVLLALGACSEQPARQASEIAPPAAVPTATVDPQAPALQASMASIPKDPGALKKLEGMGYTVHEDHMHAPGVISCPKMGDDPIM